MHVFYTNTRHLKKCRKVFEGNSNVPRLCKRSSVASVADYVQICQLGAGPCSTLTFCLFFLGYRLTIQFDQPFISVFSYANDISFRCVLLELSVLVVPGLNNRLLERVLVGKKGVSPGICHSRVYQSREVYLERRIRCLRGCFGFRLTSSGTGV